MTETLTNLLKITVVIFMAGNLLDLGLRIDLRAAVRGLRDVRFVILSVLWAFVLCPALAYVLTEHAADAGLRHGPHPAGPSALRAVAAYDD